MTTALALRPCVHVPGPPAPADLADISLSLYWLWRDHLEDVNAADDAERPAVLVPAIRFTYWLLNPSQTLPDRAAAAQAIRDGHGWRLRCWAYPPACPLRGLKTNEPTSARARNTARKQGWLLRPGSDLCPDCRPANGPMQRARITKGMSLADVGERLGVSSMAVSKWERGVCKPRPEHAARLREMGLPI